MYGAAGARPVGKSIPILWSLPGLNPFLFYGLNFMDESDKALAMLGQLGDPYVATGLDADGKVGIDFGAYGAPETFLVDAAGTILHKHPYALTRDVWEREFLPRIEAATNSRPGLERAE